MEISRIQPSVQPAELPFEKVAASGQLCEADNIGEASRQFDLAPSEIEEWMRRPPAFSSGSI